MEDEKKYRFTPLYDDRLCAVIHKKHPLYGRKKIQLKELCNDNFNFPEK